MLPETLDLREHAAVSPPSLEAATELEACERAALLRTWKGRMVNEHISSRVFAALLPQAMRAGLPSERLEELAGFAADELRHARACAGVVHALGGEPFAALPPLEEVPAHDDASPLEALLRNVISVSCLSETVAVAILELERRRAPEPMRSVVQGILRDEVRHARFGWRLLESVGPSLAALERARLADYLVVALASLERHELTHLGTVRGPSAAAQGLGLCERDEVRAVIYDTIEGVVVPGLEQHGVDARAAWAKARTAAAASLTARGR